MTSEAIEKMRAEFEKWTKSENKNVDLFDDGTYDDFRTEWMWQAWQACRSRVLEEAAQATCIHNVRLGLHCSACHMNCDGNQRMMATRSLSGVAPVCPSCGGIEGKAHNYDCPEAQD